MNTTIFVALVISWAILFVFRKVILSSMMGRAALKEVGERALARVPTTVSLLKTDSPAWTHAAEVEAQAAPLRKEGLTDLGAYNVSTMPGIVIRMMAHPETNVAAHIYDHPKSGSWIEFATRYTDGSSHTLTTLPPTGVNHPDWVRKIQADKNTPTDHLYRQFLTQREWHEIKTVAPADTIHEFEENYAKAAQWRQQHGLSNQEVANVTVKWLEKKKAVGTTQ